jgi:hypothetical protein
MEPLVDRSPAPNAGLAALAKIYLLGHSLTSNLPRIKCLAADTYICAMTTQGLIPFMATLNRVFAATLVSPTLDILHSFPVIGRNAKDLSPEVHYFETHPGYAGDLEDYLTQRGSPAPPGGGIPQ